MVPFTVSQRRHNHGRLLSGCWVSGDIILGPSVCGVCMLIFDGDSVEMGEKATRWNSERMNNLHGNIDIILSERQITDLNHSRKVKTILNVRTRYEIESPINTQS